MKNPSSNQPVILFIEDEAPIREMLRFSLELGQFNLIEAASGKQGIELALSKQPDLILLDWMLPDQSGIEVIKFLRAHAQTQNIPIIMLTALAEEEHKVRSLSSGADDYVVKPFSPLELMARIKAVLRRTHSHQNQFMVHGLTVDLINRELIYQDQVVKLSALEFGLFAYLLKNLNRTYAREQLLAQVWPDNKYVNDRTIDAYIKKFRHILKVYGLPFVIETQRGIGYQLRHESK
ncbi:MAG: two component transcriptional regulator, winged helix family [Gammaproteobacteria bacterium]|jgi:two-component system phosphate regulon response regulator PhoB|nr:two component transcriptional regulator, winged helix family [Gammaproteobacteria bacterium]